MDPVPDLQTGDDGAEAAEADDDGVDEERGVGLDDSFHFEGQEVDLDEEEKPHETDAGVLVSGRYLRVSLLDETDVQEKQEEEGGLPQRPEVHVRAVVAHAEEEHDLGKQAVQTSRSSPRSIAGRSFPRCRAA